RGERAGAEARCCCTWTGWLLGSGSTRRLIRGCPAVHTGETRRYCFTGSLLGCSPAILGRERPYRWAWAGSEARYMATSAGKSYTALFVSDNAGAPATMRMVVIGSLLISGKAPGLLATAARQPPNLPPQFWGLLGVRPHGQTVAR